MYISAKADYATRALVALAAAGGGPVKGEVLAREQDLPFKFLENTLTTLRRAGILEAQRGADGGYRLARPADSISIADIMRPVDGPLAEVRGGKPEEAVYRGPAVHLRDVWVAVRAALREVLETVTLADVVAGDLPPSVVGLLNRPGAWERRTLPDATAPSPPPGRPSTRPKPVSTAAVRAESAVKARARNSAKAPVAVVAKGTKTPRPAVAPTRRPAERSNAASKHGGAAQRGDGRRRPIPPSSARVPALRKS